MAVEAVVSVVVETLGNMLVEKAVFLKGVEGDVEWVRNELKRMQCFLKDAAKKQSDRDSDSIRNWISEIREVAYDAEDAIEKFVLNVETRGLQERCACFPDHLNNLNNIGKEIESIRKRLEDIEKSRLRYGIRDLDESSRTRSQIEVEWRRRVEYWKQDRDVVGLEKDVQLLLHGAILEEKGDLSVASIIGMGGIGKSTLAKKLYNHPKIAGQFECRAWVVVSSEFTAEDILKEILEKLEVPGDRLKLLEAVDDKLRYQQRLQEELYSFLTGKRYFIVLDDVWEPKHWQSFENSFPKEDKASRLLLTSRNQAMGEYSQFVHNMKVLDTNQSWELFMKKAFIHNTEGKCPEEVQNIGDEILKWCGGLPLAISVVGGVLQKKTPSKKEWEKVVKEMKSHLERNEGINSISAVLELSYHNLPPELKACFLCLGLFKEDAVIEAKNIVHIWVAQGLVAQEVVGEEETMEDVATNYLNQLISRNMVQVKSRKYDVVEECQTHDLLRDLSQRKAKEEINLEVLMREEGDSHNPFHKPRHRAIHYSGMRFDSYANQNQYLRSLFIIGESEEYGAPSSYWKRFELLRVLDLGNVGLDVLPKAVGALTGLRYIKMRYVGRTSKLPRSWGKLTNLQVLDLWDSGGGAGYIILDKVILKMKRLRHLYAHISFRSRVPLGNMKKLQTLRLFPLEDASVWQIQGMGGVTTLGIDMFAMSDTSELFTHLATLGNLVSLNLKYCFDLLNMDGLSALHRITELKLENFIKMKRLPTNLPPKLSYLTLSGMELVEDPMPVLERLPELLYLKLEYLYHGEQMVISHLGFPKLKVLSLKRISANTNIQIDKGGMPELKHLFIHTYPDFNIENLPEHVKSAITDG